MRRHTSYHNQSPSETAYWHFRTNDLSQEQYDKLVNLEGVEWIVIGEIEHEEDKGSHYHVAVKFERSRRKSYALAKLLFNNQAVLDKDYYLEGKYTKATVSQFIDYCIKNGVRYDTYGLNELDMADESEGKPDVKMSKLELQKLRIQKVREGDEDWFLENDFQFMMGSQYAKLCVLAQPHKTEIIQGELKNYWIWGTSGTGKSMLVHNLWPEAYSKVVSNEKWDGYSNTKPGHKVVHIEEVDDFTDIEKGLEGLAGLKRMADRYPFPVRFNYGNRNLMIRPETIVITSNFSPSQILSKPDKRGNTCSGLEIQLQAIARKFKILHISQAKKLFNKEDIIKNGKLVGLKDAILNTSTPGRERRLMNMEDTRYWNEPDP